jgi:hypothetical protein
VDFFTLSLTPDFVGQFLPNYFPACREFAGNFSVELRGPILHALHMRIAKTF